MEEYRFINEIGFNQSRRNRRAAFDHQACDAAFCEEVEHFARIKSSLCFRNANNFSAVLAHGCFGCGRRMLAGHDP